MVAPMYRSRSKKRRSIRTPGGKSVIHYKKKKVSKHHCGRCGNALSGVPNAIPSAIGKMSKSERIPERPYAGVLCSDCTEALMRYTTKFEVKFGYPEFADMDFKRDLTIEKFLPRGWWTEISKDAMELESDASETVDEPRDETNGEASEAEGNSIDPTDETGSEASEAEGNSTEPTDEKT